jgi:serine protease Do
MKKRMMLVGAGLAASIVVLFAVPSRSVMAQNPDESERLQQRLEGMQQRLDEAQLQRLEQVRAALDRAKQVSHAALQQYESSLQRVQILPDQEPDDTISVLVGEGPSWLGVETHEVTGELVKELKLPAERGVVIGNVTADSPAAKAGLKEKDVITEVDGERVEGTAQFRRIIHEIPAGRTISLGLWRDGRSQTISVTLGKAEERHQEWMRTAPGAFAFQMPDVQIPPMPSIDLGGDFTVFAGGRARLGIDAEEIGGQLGSFFGAPDGEGILVRSVNAGSAAEKAGMKAGDVITNVNGERVRTVGDLREKLAKAEDKPVQIGVLREKNKMTLTVELPKRTPGTSHHISRRTFI